MLAQIEGNKIKCYDCYSVKDTLKDFGFKWNKEEKAWESSYHEFLEEELQFLGFEIIKPSEKQAPAELINELKERNPKALDHQLLAAALAIKEKSFLIGDEPGAGKTFTALIYSEYLLAKDLVDIVFIFCPASIKRQWQQEVNKWLNETAFVINGAKKQREKIFWAIRNTNNIKIVILNYELLLTEDVFNFLNSFDRFALVMDEASRVKNPKTKTFKKLYKIASNTEYKLAMTGTPIENSLQEFWGIGYMLKGNKFMSWEDFENNHIYYTEIKPRHLNFYIKKVSGYRNLRRFIAKISPFYIRRKKSDIKQMPLLTEYTREVEQSKLQAKLEDYILQVALEGVKTEMEALTRLSLLRAVADDPRLLLNSDSTYAQKVAKTFEKEIKKAKNNPKIEELKQIIEEHSDKKVIILTQFKRMAKVLYKQFDNAVLVTGDDSNDQKAVKIGQFKNKDYRLLIGTDAITYGMSIDEADVLVNFDIPWSVGKIIQRRDRIYRISSTRPKWVYYLVSEGAEKKVWQILQEKKELFNQVVEGEALGDLRNEILKVLIK